MDNIKYIYLAVLFISTIIGLSDFSKCPPAIKLVCSFVVLSLCVEMIGFYTLGKSKGEEVNIDVYKLYLLLECIILGAYFYFILKNRQKAILVSFLLLFILEVCMLNFSLLSFHKTYIISIFFKSYFSVLYLYFCLNNTENIIQNPHFWIVTGILFFNAGFFFLSGFINYISSKDLELARKLFTINHLLNIIYYSLITYGFICQRRLARLSS